MKRLLIGMLVFATSVVITVSAGSQSPDGKDKKNPKDDKGGGFDGKKGPPRFELGKVLPPFVREELELTEEQEKQIEELEKMVKEKLSKILTKEQKKKIETIRPKMKKGPDDGKGPPDDKDDKKGPPEGKEGKEKKDRPVRPDMGRSQNEELPQPRVSEIQRD